MAGGQATATRPHAHLNTSLLALVVLASSLLRFVGLGKESIWLDEATSIIIARMSLSSVVAWAAGDIHPPLYYLVLHFWLRIGESEFAVRALSAMLGIFTIVVTYALAKELFDWQVGLLSALLLSLSPLHIGYSQEARMYVMVTLWSLLASYLMLLALRRQRSRYWVGYVFATTLALYTHYFALFVLLFQNLFIVFWFWRTCVYTSADTRDPRQLWLRWLLVELAIAVLFLPWIPILYHQATTGGGGWVEKSVGQPSLRTLLDTWIYFSIGLDGQLYPSLLRRVAYVLFGACILSALSRLFPKRGSTAEQEGLLFCLMYLAVPLLTAWLLSQVKPMYTVRYLLPFLPAYCILLAAGMKRMGVYTGRGNHLDRRSVWCRWLHIGGSLLLALVLLVGDWNAWRLPRNADWRSASFYVLEQAQPGDVVLFSPRWNVKPFDYYARGRVPINMDLPIPVTENAAQSVVNDIAPYYQRVWLFWERGHYSDPTGLAKQLLDSQFDLVQIRNFHGIESLFLYALRK